MRVGFMVNDISTEEAGYTTCRLGMAAINRGHEVWVSVRDANKVEIYDARTFEKRGELALRKPSGVFFAARANRIGL